MKHQVDTGTASSTAPVIGVDVARLDRSLRQAAASLFPKERGLILLTLLFLYGEVQEQELDGSGPVEVVVIRISSVELFARAHQGWSKDTALRYICVMEALQILQRHRHAEYTEVHVPLIPWVPSEAALAALDKLLVEDAARAKLQQLASGVKERFLLLYGPPHSDIRDHLNKRMSPTKRRLLQMRVRNLQAQLEASAKKKDVRTELTAEDDAKHRGDTTPTQPVQRHARRNESKVVKFHNKRAEVVALPATLTVEEWRMTLEYFHHTCAYCEVTSYQVLEHFVPLTSGGGTTSSNCVPACVSCNSMKGDQDPRVVSPSSALAGALQRVQIYLQTGKTIGEVNV